MAGAGRDSAVRILQKARPLLSVNEKEAKARALSLYRSWYRQIPYIGNKMIGGQIDFPMFRWSFSKEISHDHLSSLKIHFLRGRTSFNLF